MPRKPNLLVIHTDQQSCWSLSAYGGTLVDTPHIDSVAREDTAGNADWAHCEHLFV